MVTETEIVALSVCDSVTCGVRPCSVVRTEATVCESFGSLRSNVKVAESVTVSAGLKSQEAFCVVIGMVDLVAQQIGTRVRHKRKENCAGLKPACGKQAWPLQ